MGAAARVGLLLAVAATDKCGPNQREVGEAVLIAWPLIMLLALVPQAGLLALWRKLRPDVELSLRPFVASVAIASAISIFTIVMSPEKPFRWIGEALWLFGTSYGAVLFAVTRLWLLGDRRHALAGPHLVASVVFIPFAMTLRAGLFDQVKLDVELIFILPGYGGWITGALALAFGIEAFVRWRRLQKMRAA